MTSWYGIDRQSVRHHNDREVLRDTLRRMCVCVCVCVPIVVDVVV